jgi:hypothetical protein
MMEVLLDRAVMHFKRREIRGGLQARLRLLGGMFEVARRLRKRKRRLGVLGGREKG